MNKKNKIIPNNIHSDYIMFLYKKQNPCNFGFEEYCLGYSYSGAMFNVYDIVLICVFFCMSVSVNTHYIIYEDFQDHFNWD